MHKVILILLASLSLFACNNVQDAYMLDVDVEGSEGKWVKLLTRSDASYYTYDSVMLDSGSTHAVLSASVDKLTTMHLTIEGMEGSTMLLVENADYKITGSLNNPEIKTKSKAQNDLNEYNDQLRPLTNQMQEVITELRKGQNDSLLETYYALYEEQAAIDSAYIADNPASFATVLALSGSYYNLDVDELETALTKLDTSLHVMEEYQSMHLTMLTMKSVAIGKPYTDFSLNTPDGELLKVSDVHQGNVLLIDFWASWCGPCRRANPELVMIYNDYHEKGFEILGVSLDRDYNAWTTAIADDGLVWKHISDLKYWQSAGAKLYGVPAIPHTVLIDREGVITAKKLHGQELREAIEALL